MTIAKQQDRNTEPQDKRLTVQMQKVFQFLSYFTAFDGHPKGVFLGAFLRPPSYHSADARSKSPVVADHHESNKHKTLIQSAFQEWGVAGLSDVHGRTKARAEPVPTTHWAISHCVWSINYIMAELVSVYPYHNHSLCRVLPGGIK